MVTSQLTEDGRAPATHFAGTDMRRWETLRNPIPPGFSLRLHKGFHIVLRNDLHPNSCDLIVSLASLPNPTRGRVVIENFPLRDGGKITGAFRRTVRGGPYSRLGWETSFGLVPRTLSELHVTQNARQSGVPTVLPIGCCWRRSTGWLGYTSAFISVYQEEAMNLFDLVIAWSENGNRPRNRQGTLVSVARAIKQLHASGIHHPDLTLRNLLIQPDNSCLIADFDKAKQSSSISQQSIVSGLSRLNRSIEKSHLARVISVRDRLRFLCHYFDGSRRHDVRIKHIMVRASLALRFHRMFWKQQRGTGEDRSAEDRHH